MLLAPAARPTHSSPAPAPCRHSPYLATTLTNSIHVHKGRRRTLRELASGPDRNSNLAPSCRSPSQKRDGGDAKRLPGPHGDRGDRPGQGRRLRVAGARGRRVRRLRQGCAPLRPLALPAQLDLAEHQLAIEASYAPAGGAASVPKGKALRAHVAALRAQLDRAPLDTAWNARTYSTADVAAGAPLRRAADMALRDACRQLVFAHPLGEAAMM